MTFSHMLPPTARLKIASWEKKEVTEEQNTHTHTPTRIDPPKTTSDTHTTMNETKMNVNYPIGMISIR